MKNYQPKWATGTLTTICGHERPQESGRPSCGMNGGKQFRAWLKAKLKNDDFWGSHLAVTSGCVGTCPKKGVAITVTTPNSRKSFLVTDTDDLEKAYRKVIRPAIIECVGGEVDQN